MKAVVIAAGKGTRMQPLTLTMSKGMIPVANRPLLAWTREFLDFCDEIIIIASRKQKDIIDYFEKDGKVKIIFQEKPKGTGDALLAAEHHVDGRFIVIYGDDVYGKGDIEKIAGIDSLALGSVVHDNPELYGIVDVENDLVRKVEEKPEKPKTNLVNCGLYVFDKRVFGAIRKIKKSPRGEYELTDAVNVMLQENVEIRNHTVKAWIPFSYPWNILDANKYLLEEHGSLIHKTAEIRKGAVIEEPVSIGEGAVIGPNCFIRKYSSIGANCKIGQAVEIKNSIIMDNSFVSHISYVGDSVIGRNCNVGGGTIFANLRLDEKNVKMEINGTRVDSGKKKLGAIVGDGVKFGTRATVMPGKRIWPKILVPACLTVEEDVKIDLPLSKYRKNGE